MISLSIEVNTFKAIVQDFINKISYKWAELLIVVLNKYMLYVFENFSTATPVFNSITIIDYKSIGHTNAANILVKALQRCTTISFLSLGTH